jgi:isoleucyl-tRNA synthetase
LHEIDRWVLGQLNDVIDDVRAAYERFEFYRIYQRIYQFCAVDLSSFYLDVLRTVSTQNSPTGPSVGRRSSSWPSCTTH